MNEQVSAIPVTRNDIGVVPGRELFQKNREAGMGIEVHGQTYKVAAFYDLGGADMFRGTSNARGFSLMCRPMEFTSYGTRLSLFDAGLRQFMEPAPRFSDKKFDAFVEKHFFWNEADQRVDFSSELLNLIAKVVARHHAGVRS